MFQERSCLTLGKLCWAAQLAFPLPSCLPASARPPFSSMHTYSLTCPDRGLRVLEAASSTCSFVLTCVFKLGTTEVSSRMHPKFPLEKSSVCSAEGSSAAKRHTIAFAWGLDWFALEGLHPAWFRPSGRRQISVEVTGNPVRGTLSSSARKGRNQFLVTAIVLFAVQCWVCLRDSLWKLGQFLK